MKMEKNQEAEVLWKPPEKSISGMRGDHFCQIMLRGPVR